MQSTSEFQLAFGPLRSYRHGVRLMGNWMSGHHFSAIVFAMLSSVGVLDERVDREIALPSSSSSIARSLPESALGQRDFVFSHFGVKSNAFDF